MLLKPEPAVRFPVASFSSIKYMLEKLQHTQLSSAIQVSILPDKIYKLMHDGNYNKNPQDPMISFPGANESDKIAVYWLTRMRPKQRQNN